MRSAAYYQDPQGKRKKRDLNQKRRRQPSPVPPASAPVAATCSARWDPHLLEYVRMVVSLIEGRAVSRTEILEMLQRFLRQHSLGRRSKIDHTVAWLHEHPP